MSTQGHEARPRSPFRLALPVLSLLACLAAPATAAAQSVLRQADEHYQAGRLPQAEAAYRRALVRSGGDRRHCYERLLTIYTLAGRQDQGVTLGLEYERWLRAEGDLARA